MKCLQNSKINFIFHFTILSGLFLLLLSSLSFPFFTTASSIETALAIDDPKIPIDEAITGGQGYELIGEIADDWAGAHVYGVDDVNRDGYDDFVIGAFQQKPGGTGKAYLILGRPASQWTSFSLSKANASFLGENVGDIFGRWIAKVGDVNNDGFDDFAISAMANSESAPQAGQTYLFFGGATRPWALNTPLSQANASFLGEGAKDYSGHGVYGVGDTNSDGYDDFIISGEGNDEGGFNRGQAYLIFGRPTNSWSKDTPLNLAANASFIGIQNDSLLGFDAAGVGDVNNDGFSDFALGVFHPTDNKLADENNDGFSDALFGVKRQVFLILGGSSPRWRMDLPISCANASFLFEELPSDGYTLSGDWLSGMGDVNQDGYDDFLVGTYRDSEGGEEAGKSYLFLGRPTNQWLLQNSSDVANASFIGEAVHDWSGWSVAGAGDVNNDGYDDFIIGACNLVDLGLFSGAKAYLFLGRSTNLWSKGFALLGADVTFSRQGVHSGFGIHVAGVGDVNNDGFDDFTISASHDDEAGRDAGKVYLLLGLFAPGTPSTTTDSEGLSYITPLGLTLSLVTIIWARKRRNY
ncbi:MAG: integrin alpha [Candidatus Hodarchaeota archaeon]